MGRAIKTNISYEEVFLDEDLYPRSSYNWQTAYDYSQSMKVGAVFPPIVLAMYQGRKYLVDGKHRLEAYKLTKVKSIPAIIHTGWNREKIFKEAVKLNITHGRGLSPYEKRRIALKLMEMKNSKQEISQLVQVPLDKLDEFVSQRLVNSITGEEITLEDSERISKEIGNCILKSGLKHFAGQTLPAEEFDLLNTNQKRVFESSQVSLLEEVVRIIEKNLLDKTNPKVLALVVKLKKLFKGL